MDEQNKAATESVTVTPVAGFDPAIHFQIKIMSGGEKQCTVRFPSDPECCAWGRKHVTVRRFLGRGKSETQDIGADEADAQIFALLRIDRDGDAFDAAEAGRAIARLLYAAPQEIEREGNQYRVTVKVVGGLSTVHVLRMPTAKQARDHEAASVRTLSARRTQEMRALLEPSGELYDALHDSHSGYAGAVPIAHKVAVVSEIMQELSAATEDDDSPE